VLGAGDEADDVEGGFADVVEQDEDDFGSSSRDWQRRSTDAAAAAAAAVAVALLIQFDDYYVFGQAGYHPGSVAQPDW
jgi:hypothetical protein